MTEGRIGKEADGGNGRRDRPLRVVVYTDAAGIGGAEISLGHLVATAAADVQITVVGVAAAVVQAIADRRPQSAHQPARLVLPARGFAAFWRHVFAFWRLRADVIHVNLCTPWAGAIGLTAALLLPQVRVVRVDQLPLRTTAAVHLWRTRALSLRVDAHVAVGEYSARRMEDFYALGRNTVVSIPNGVPDCVPASIPDRVPASVSDRVSVSAHAASPAFVVGSVGRLDAMKAHDILIRAIVGLEDVQVVIVGEGEQRAALTALAGELGVSDRVKLLGWSDDPRSYLSGFDVVALPSRSEGFPLAMVEAMLAARPIVATAVGSMPEAIISEQTGLVIAKNDVAGLTEALRRLRDDRALGQRLGEQARAMAVAHFTAEVMTARYQRLWAEVMTRPRTDRLWVARPKD